MAWVFFTVSQSVEGLARLSDARILCQNMEWHINSIDYGTAENDDRKIGFGFNDPDHAALFKLTWIDR